ncbi:MAG: AmmeMemoRadiSam system protein A [Nanoarchaeota archaeon]
MSRELLKFARKLLENHFNSHIKYDAKELAEKFKEKRGVFVTLHKKGELRGCIGYVYPLKSVYDSVKENTFNAAFHDPRFPPLQKEELKDVRIEISILSPPKLLRYSSAKELLKKLTKKEGVILEKDGQRTTFLPQVWEELPDKEEFLSHLSTKAGLSPDAWKEAKIYIYFVEAFEE